MSGRWASSRRRDTLPADWPRLRAYVLDRDGHTCQLRYPDRCVGTAAHADHVVPHHLGGSDDPGNLAAACPPCHGLKSALEGAAARPRLNRPVELHPGLL